MSQILIKILDVAHAAMIIMNLKVKDQLWSCDCTVKETLWNRSEKVDHLAFRNWCVLQGSGIIKMIRNMAQSSKSYKHCTQKDVYGTIRTRARHMRLSLTDHVDKLIYQIYQLVGSFAAKKISPCISQNIFFYMIGNKSFHFIFWNWGVSKNWSLPLRSFRNIMNFWSRTPVWLSRYLWLKSETKFCVSQTLFITLQSI